MHRSIYKNIINISFINLLVLKLFIFKISRLIMVRGINYG